MSDFSLKTLQTSPVLDFELLLENNRERRIEGALMDRLMDEWSAWMSGLHALHITEQLAGRGDGIIGANGAESDAGSSWLAVWLDQAIEEKVDRIWNDSPSEAFLHNALAQTLCMSAVYDLLPETAELGCAPLPQASPALLGALEAAGLRDSFNKNKSDKIDNGDKDADRVAGLGLKRRYAVVTGYPFRVGCEVCALRKECPGLKPRNGVYSVVLPGRV